MQFFTHLLISLFSSCKLLAHRVLYAWNCLFYQMLKWICVFTSCVFFSTVLCFKFDSQGFCLFRNIFYVYYCTKFMALPCLIPSSFPKVGDHGHSHRRSPLIPVSGHSCRQWPPCPVLDVVQPSSSWTTSVSLAVDSALECMSVYHHLQIVMLSAWSKGASEKLSLETPPEQLQRCGWPHLLCQAVPDSWCVSSKGTVNQGVYNSWKSWKSTVI